MADGSAPQVPLPVKVHDFEPSRSLIAYESGNSESSHALVMIGGLGDGPHTVGYFRHISHSLEHSGLGWSVFEPRLRSSFDGFGWNSLAHDVEDISALVTYLRGIGKKSVVLMGHSTGSQDCLEYTNYEKHKNAPVDGFILQAPVSDRESLAFHMGQDLDKAITVANEMIKSGRQDDCMPRAISFFQSPITAYRFHSLAAVGGDDDLFSSDLPDDEVASIWGRVRQPILVVPSGEDEHVPKTINVEQLIVKWKSFCAPGIFSSTSGLIPGASHAVTQQASQKWLADRVLDFVASLTSDTVRV